MQTQVGGIKVTGIAGCVRFTIFSAGRVPVAPPPFVPATAQEVKSTQQILTIILQQQTERVNSISSRTKLHFSPTAQNALQRSFLAMRALNYGDMRRYGTF